MARFRLGVHLLAGTASISDEGFDGQAEHQEVHNYHYPSQSEPAGSAAQMGAGGVEFQLGGIVGKHLLIGLYGSMEVGSSNAPDRTIKGLSVRPNQIVQFKTGGQLGVSIPVGGWLLRGDAMVGLRATSLGMETQIGDCIQQSMAWDLDLMVEPRVGIEKWLSPWLSAGVMVGSDIRRDRDMTVVVGFTGHTSAFDSRGAVGLPW